mmetsp:Transcript_24825/g.37730  ORF Transcript_24825/g.37730 Transcript_24825/m.37730 type:complete len:737 (+) Transcript_24825:128-2338(+)
MSMRIQTAETISSEGDDRQERYLPLTEVIKYSGSSNENESLHESQKHSVDLKCSVDLPSPSSTTGESTTSEDRIHMNVSSNITGFVTFLKGLFGVGLLSSPNILDETGLLLGSLCYFLIIAACTFACYLLLQARATVVLKYKHRTNQQVISYGRLGHKLLGRKLAALATFLIVTLHLFFGSHMVSASAHMLAEAFNWEGNMQAEDYESEWEAVYNNNGEADDAVEVVDYNDDAVSLWFQVKLMLGIFPFVALLLQFRNVKELAMICTSGLMFYLFGCVGTMVYATTLVHVVGEEEDENDKAQDAPQDMWQWKFGGVPKFVASSLCAVEGINLALPTANNLKNSEKAAVPVVLSVFIFYGFFTLVIAWIGYLGGLGGGLGTAQGEDSCSYISECLPTALLSHIYEASLGVALLCTLPIILYPSLEMLQLMFDERGHQIKIREKNIGKKSMIKSWNRFSSRHVLDKKGESFSTMPSERIDRNRVLPRGETMTQESGIDSRGGDNNEEDLHRYSALETLTTEDNKDFNNYFPDRYKNFGKLLHTSLGKEFPSAVKNEYNEFSYEHQKSGHHNKIESELPQQYKKPYHCDDVYINSGREDIIGKIEGLNKYTEEREAKNSSCLHRHWRLRLAHALIVCVLGALERLFEEPFALITGIGLSIAAFILPCVLYVHATPCATISIGMKFALASLVGLGISNAVMVCISVFTDNKLLPDGPIYHINHEKDLLFVGFTDDAGGSW